MIFSNFRQIVFPLFFPLKKNKRIFLVCLCFVKDTRLCVIILLLRMDKNDSLTYECIIYNSSSGDMTNPREKCSLELGNLDLIY